MKVEILTLDEPNKNGRTYTTECVEDAILKLGGKNLMGQVGLPEEGNPLTPFLNLSHLVSNLRIEDGKLVGTMTILNTPNGKIAANLLEAQNFASIGCAFRPRGTGNVDANGIVSDYEMLSIDLVADAA